MIIAFFDFDGTISKKDTLIHFIRFAVGDLNFLLGIVLLSPTILMYKLKLINSHYAKQMVISYYFKNYKEVDFINITRSYSLNKLSKIIRPEAIKKILWHKEQGHKVVVVSASIDYWLKPWCKINNLELIATKLEVKNGKISGKFLTKNCNGIEKVNRIRKLYNLEKFREIYAYGDSKGDEQMLALTNKNFYKPFK